MDEYSDETLDLTLNEEPQENKRRWGVLEKKNDPPIVLEPDHPLVQKFQATHKQFLEKELDRVNTEILEQREVLKSRKQNYARLMSEDIYNLEQAVSRQRDSILECEEALEKAAIMRIEKSEIVREKREMFKEHHNLFNEQKKKEYELLGELEALSLLCKQYESWKEDMESNLTVNQRISEKLVVEKTALTEQKKNMDLMVYNLTTEVWRLESQIELIEDEMQIKTQELEGIKTRSADGTADLEALHMEEKHLLQLWNSVIVNIQQKDKLHVEASNEYENVQNELRSLVATIESIKKETDKEMHRHEEITAKRDKVAYELAESSKAVDVEERKQTDLEYSLIETSSILEMTEKDLHTEKAKEIQNKNTMKDSIKLHEKLAMEKMALENEILDKLQEQFTCDKATKDIAVKIKHLKEISRNAEINMIKNENRNAKIHLKIERQRVLNSQKLQELETEKKLCQEKETELQAIVNKLKESASIIDKRMTELANVDKKISVYLEKTGGKDISPVEKTIEDLENEIDNHTKKIKQLQQDWIRMQSHFVHLSQQYQKNVTEMNLTREQIQILEYKIMRLENAINTHKVEESKMQKTLYALQTRIDQLSKQMAEDKDHNQDLEKKYNDLILEYSAKLKELEMEMMNIEEELLSLEEEKVRLAVDLNKIKREVLSWEKMGILAMETKQKVDEEKSASGVIGRMKMEIHRMKVRRGQVASTSARLASDLAQMVGRREAVVYRARACSKSVAPRHTFLFKIKEKKSDIRRLNQEIEVNRNLMEKSKKENELFGISINEKLTILLELENETEDLKKQVEESQLSKQKNLEKIIRHQRYGQHCMSILSGQKRIYSIKSEPGITVEYDKQRQINNKLIRLVQQLLEEMPEHQFTWMRVLNTLNVEE